MTTAPVNKRRIILHLGAPKTGSTSLQYYLSENAEVLRRAGIVYPERMIRHGRVDVLHTHLVQMRTRARPEPAFEAARARLNTLFEESGAHSLLLSNESLLGEPYHADKTGFFPHHAKWLAELKRLFVGYEVDVIYFIRRFESFLPSYYVQYVRKGGTLTLEAFCAHIAEGGISWCPVVAALKSTFGESHVRVFDHAALRDKPADTICAAFGQYAPSLPAFSATEYNQNPAVGRGVLAAYRFLNRLFTVLVPRSRQRHLRPKLRKYLFTPLALLSANRAPRLPGAKTTELRALFARDSASLSLEDKR